MADSGLSPDDLSGRSGIARSRLDELMAGAEPTVVELRDLAAALRISISDFLASTEPEREVSLLFRQTIAPSRKRASRKPVDNLSTKVAHAFELLPDEETGPSWPSELRPLGHAYKDAERLASAFRDRFFDGNDVAPIPELPRIAVGRMGILLYLVDSGEFEGASALLKARPFVFLSRRTFTPRMLFTLAHEIGHLLAHDDSQDFAVLDIPSDVEQLRARGRPEEAFVNAFASCLLLPPAGVGVALRKIREVLGSKKDGVGDVELLYLARVFAVSFQVAAKRCEDLGLIPRGGAASLDEHMRRRRSNPEKYAEELGLPARPDIEFPALPPTLLADAVEGIRSGRVSIGRASSILNLSIADIFRVHAAAWQPR